MPWLHRDARLNLRLSDVRRRSCPLHRMNFVSSRHALARQIDTHLGPPIVIKRLSGPDSSLCAVAALEDLLQLRSSLQLDHDYVFFQFKPPYEKVSTASFSQRLAWALKAAGISAPPGSTRSVSVSDAFSRGVDLAAILRAGDWSGAQTFYRHYLRPSVASSQR